METHRDKIISFLKEHPEGTDDDELAYALGLKQRQEANNICRELEKQGLVERKKVKGKIHNFWKIPVEASKPSDNVEGSITSKILDFLKGLIEQGATKKCPFCAEKIKAEAIKCKHCGSMLE